ncbi:MAG TPA: hypothetical protein VHH35_05935 [Pyrinomonadaceae bacterium]|nr:hypothetical protein [Pyrinomonadaceae bacterium]
MNDKHIIETIDNVSLASLSKSELEEVRVHARACESCGTAFEAAQISALMIKERAHTKIEPSPFFHTKVLAAWREQQAAESVPAFVRLWKSASALVSSMAVATIALAALTFVVPEPATAVQDQTASSYSAESVIFDQSDDQLADGQLTYAQVLNAIYEEEDEAR